MNPQDLEIFNSIVTKDPQDLDEMELAVLKARRSYLTFDQKRIFESVLLEKVAEEEPKLYVSRKDREALEKAQ